MLKSFKDLVAKRVGLRQAEQAFSQLEAIAVAVEDTIFDRRLAKWVHSEEALTMCRDFALNYEPARETYVKEFKESEEGQTWRLEKVGVDEVTRDVAEKIVAKAVEGQWDCFVRHIEEWKVSDEGLAWQTEGSDADASEIVSQAIEDEATEITDYFDEALAQWKQDEGEEWVIQCVADDSEPYRQAILDEMDEGEVWQALGDKAGWG